MQPRELLGWAQQVGEEVPAALVSAIEFRNPEAKRKVRPSDEKKVKLTLLKIILGIAVDKYRFDPLKSHNATAKHISSRLGELGLKVTEDTVHKYLSEAADEFDDEIKGWMSSP